jgi:hypothetical protein
MLERPCGGDLTAPASAACRQAIFDGRHKLLAFSATVAPTQPSGSLVPRWQRSDDSPPIEPLACQVNFGWHTAHTIRL